MEFKSAASAIKTPAVNSQTRCWTHELTFMFESKAVEVTVFAKKRHDENQDGQRFNLNRIHLLSHRPRDGLL